MGTREWGLGTEEKETGGNGTGKWGQGTEDGGLKRNLLSWFIAGIEINGTSTGSKIYNSCFVITRHW